MGDGDLCTEGNAAAFIPNRMSGFAFYEGERAPAVLTGGGDGQRMQLSPFNIVSDAVQVQAVSEEMIQW